MAITQDKRKKAGLPEHDPAGQDRQKDGTQDLEKLEEGQEITPDAAERLQPQLGNQAVQALLARTSTTTQTATGTADVEIVEEHELDEEIEGGDLEVPAIQFGGGGGGDGLPGDGQPWEISRLFGDDDDDPAARRRPGTRIAPPSRATIDEIYDDEIPEDDPDELPADAMQRIEDALGETPTMADEHRSGDARYRAIEAALTIPHTLGRRALVPERLVDRTDHLDPIGRPAIIGRFLSQSAVHPEARAVARVLAGPASILLPTDTGHAGACARLASWTVSAQAREGHIERTDDAVRLALCHDAWSDAVLAARTVAERGPVVAPAIVDELIPEDDTTARTPKPRFHFLAEAMAPVHLGIEALSRIIPEPWIPSIPPLALPDAPSSVSPDPATAAADAALAQFTEGTDQTDIPEEQALTWAALQPVLDAATALVNAMGRTQVECAAAAIAIRRVRPSAPVRHVLVHTDRALRNLARSVVHAGDRLHKARGRPMAATGNMSQEAIRDMRDAANALHSLRTWAFAALAEGVTR